MGEVIKEKALLGKNTVAVARWLIGKVLVRQLTSGAVTRHIIVETEAYHGESDLACHASKGRTLRTDVLYRRGGVWYVYLCYGVHEMLNLVVGPEGFPAAVLIRGLHDVTGPGRLTRTLEIDRALNGAPMAITSGLWVEDEGWALRAGWVKATTRIGVNYAGPLWAGKRWRFVVDPSLLDRLTGRHGGVQNVVDGNLR